MHPRVSWGNKQHQRSAPYRRLRCDFWCLVRHGSAHCVIVRLSKQIHVIRVGPLWCGKGCCHADGHGSPSSRPRPTSLLYLGIRGRQQRRQNGVPDAVTAVVAVPLPGRLPRIGPRRHVPPSDPAAVAVNDALDQPGGRLGKDDPAANRGRQQRLNTGIPGVRQTRSRSSLGAFRGYPLVGLPPGPATYLTSTVRDIRLLLAVIRSRILVRNFRSSALSPLSCSPLYRSLAA